MASDRAIAQQTQEKFQFYFLALTFTLLAAAIQTSQFGRSTVEDVLELAGWIGLLAAGIVALWKMEWDSVIRVQMAKRDKVATAMSNLQQQMHQGLTEVFVLETGQPVSAEVKLTHPRRSNFDPPGRGWRLFLSRRDVDPGASGGDQGFRTTRALDSADHARDRVVA